jgi:hypothetical protein
MQRAALRGLTATQLDKATATRRNSGLFDLIVPMDTGARTISAIPPEEMDDWWERCRRLVPSLLAVASRKG